MPNRGRGTIRPSYVELKALNLGTTPIREQRIIPGRDVPVVVDEDDELEMAGSLQPYGLLSGLGRLFRKYSLRVGDQFEYALEGRPPSEVAVRLFLPENVKGRAKLAVVDQVEEDDTAETPPVLSKQGVRSLHLDVFRLDNFEHWEPREEKDLYYVFGYLRNAGYEDYDYCCSVNKELQRALGLPDGTKPDMVLVDLATGQYLIGEFKMSSSAFVNWGAQSSGDVDVLFVWEDDIPENDAARQQLPGRVVVLKAVARSIYAESIVER